MPCLRVAVDAQEVLAFHALLAGEGADQQRVVDVLEGDIGIVGKHQAAERREAAIVELHGDPFQRRQGRPDFQELQDDLGVWPENLARREAPEHGIRDLAGRSGNCDTNDIRHSVSSLKNRQRVCRFTARS